MENNYRHNLIRLYILKVSHWFMITMPIIVLFFTDNGLSMSQVFILQAIYSVSIVALEIPSGYFADVLGRRNSIIAGSIMGFIGFSVYSFSFGFIGFVIAEITLGFGQSMISGADSALLYDSLKSSNSEKDYLKHEGRMTSVGNFSEAIAGVLGGLLAGLSLRYPFYFQTGIAFIGVPAAISLIEPKISQIKLGLGLKDITDVVKYALIKNQRLRWNILYSSVVGASTLAMAWFVQPWFIRANIPVSMFGITWTILNLSVGITALYAYRIELKLGRTPTTAIFTIILAIGFIASGWISSLWGLLFILLFYLARGVATPILKDNINRITPSNMRATVLSVRNFIIRVLFAVLAPFYGWTIDVLSLKAALTIAGLIFVLLAGISFFFFLKMEKSSD
ncbi:MAG: MFS transporter [Tenuifilaceae bacterium]